MYASEILEQFRAGKKEFDNIRLEFCDFTDLDFSGLVIKNSILNYTSFRHCNMKNSKFLNCKIFFFSLYGADVENLAIEKCEIDTARMDNMKTKNTRILHSKLSVVAMFGTHVSEIAFMDTEEYKVYKNISELTESEAEFVISHVGNNFGELPLEIKMRLMDIMKNALGEVGGNPELVKTSGVKHDSSYGKAGNSSAASGFYSVFSAISDEIMKYGASEAYKTNSTSYRDKKKY